MKNYDNWKTHNPDTDHWDQVAAFESDVEAELQIIHKDAPGAAIGEFETEHTEQVLEAVDRFLRAKALAANNGYAAAQYMAALNELEAAYGKAEYAAAEDRVRRRVADSREYCDPLDD
jgi:hypothetical protein